MLDIELYGLDPGRHHLTNVLFHIANTLLLFGVLRRMTGNIWRSGLVAALFALHPLHVESVAWIAERKDLLSTLFGLLAIWSYTHYGRHPRIGSYSLLVLFFILSLMAKPMLVTLPFGLLLLDFWPLRRFQFEALKKAAEPTRQITSQCSPASLIVEKIPLFILSAASCMVTLYAQNTGGAMVSLALHPLQFRIANALVAYAAYIGKMFWPQNLAGYGILSAAHRHNLFRHQVHKIATLASCWMVMVSGNTCSCDRVGASRPSGHGRPLHLYSADRIIYHHRLEFLRSADGLEI